MVPAVRIEIGGRWRIGQLQPVRVTEVMAAGAHEVEQLLSMLVQAGRGRRDLERNPVGSLEGKRRLDPLAWEADGWDDLP